MAVDANDARLQYIQNLASSTLNISRDSLGPLLASQEVAASLQQFFDGEGPMPDEGLAELLDCGVLTQAPSLRSLEQVLSEVFLPLLSKQVGTADPAGVGALPLGTAPGSAGTSSGRPRELLGNMQKYLAHIKQALQQLTGDVALPMPAVTITSVAAACKDPDVIHTFEETVAEWSSTLSDVMQRESEKRPQGKGPLAEIDFWRARSAVLSGLWEQLSMRAAADIIEVVEAGSDDRNLMAAFKGQMAELGKLVHEARDNVKFLTTLERHFRSVSSGPLAGILDTLPPLMNALRMVWIISRHYSDDARMGALFARIATELCDRVDGAVMLHQLFRMPAAEAIELLRVSKAVLESWQSTYMQVREKIETSGRDARWEFSKATLFARSNYMAEVCGHLSEMVEIVDDFFKFLGPELKAVTGDTKGIDDVIEHVQLMVEPVETAMFDVFDQVHAPQWKALRAHFYADNEKVKAATRELIDTSFRKLRSAEGAFELLQNFKSIKSRGAIQQQMMNKLVDILEQFLREIIAAQEMFDRSKGNPPLTRNQPPVAGAIHWSHQLFSRVKLTMSKLTAVEPEGSWRQMPVGQQVHERYMALAKQMMEFEKQWFQGWRENVDNIAMRHLKQPIFVRQPETCVVVVNFHPELRVLMSEAHYLDRKGFNIPPLALQVALQEDEYRAWTERLEWLLELYYKVTGALSPVEASLLSTRLQDLERCLEPGLVRLNWNNRGIDAFVASTSKAIQEFQGLHHSVQKNSAIVEKLVSGLAAAKLVADLPEGADVMELQEFYEYMEQHRAAVVESAVQRYRSLTPLLGKVEELVAGSNTGKSPQLAGYYSYWEMAVFNALVLMVLRALEKLHAMLSSAKKPLFKNSEVAIAPPVKEVSKLLSAYIKNVAESCREFVRWMDGTCLEMPDQRAKGDTDGDPVVMHFSSEVLRMQQVMGAAVQVHQDINKVAARLNRHVEGWRKYSDIWKSDRAQVLDKFKAKAPALSAFEERFARFQKQANLFWGLAHDVDVGCVSVCNSAVALAVHEECCSWTRALAAAMRELDVAAMNGVRERMAADHAALQQQPEDLEQLKGVLHVVNSIRPRHWKQLMALTGQSFDLDPKTFTLANMFAMQLHKYKEDIAKVTSSALKELTIENELKKLAESWKEQRFDLHKYTTNGADRGWVLKGVEEVTLLLEDMGLNLQSMMASPHVRPFADEVRLWEQRLSLIGECIEVWMLVQRKWMYLESIFIGSDDIRNQLPQEAKRFDTIDKAWLKIMADTAKNTNVLDACSIDGRLDQLRTLSEQLEVCQKSLSEYLDTKRCAFPRFYFISDDELLAILGTSDPTSVQEHMLKLFDNCAALKFGRGNKSIVGMTSSEGEGFAFRSQVPVEGAVEVWMTGVEAEMRRTLAVVMKEGVWNYARTPRAKWIVDCLGMVTLAGSQVRKELTPDTRRKVNTLIITDVHGRDIIDTFVRDSIMDAREFAWESQLRFYWDKAMDDLSIRQCGGMFRYGYEYMGLNGRLVITALTDRCYMTLTTAMTYRLGGAPAGPAGTGKTETVKDLAKAMGVQCVVFNCGEGLDYKAMGSIFSGLVQCGAWGCFDEFNRIEAEVLSVVSSQIKQIQEALKNDLTRFQFEGREIRLDPRAGIFITMNPGYAGRTELPDNLKALFRPVTMVVPDMEQICEIMLFSEGFDSAKVLAKKMTVLYKLAREQLSKQHHYDFGLRALKSVLVMAGALKRGAPDMSEALVLMRALRDSNLPKFVYDDVPLFLGLVGDLFPGMDCPRVRYPQFNDQVEAELAAAGYQAITVAELYGVLDKDTRDWTDGLLSNIFREVNRPLPPERDEAHYIVFDGDVDAVWVENMNSVMDDNKLLTLPNGERIRLQPHVKLLFEVADLQYASPATISRCGMVYVDSRNLGCKPYFWRWLNTRIRPGEAEALQLLIDKYAVPAIEWVAEGLDGHDLVKRPQQSVPHTNLNMAAQLCKLLDATIIDHPKMQDPQVLDALFVFCCVWSIGALLVQRPEAKERDRFDALMKQLAALGTVDADRVSCSQLPSRSLYEYCFDVADGCWRSWRSYVTEYVPPVSGHFSKILVSTADTVRTSWLLRTVVGSGSPCLLIGESGTSKSVTISNFLASLDAAASISLNMNFSSRTSSLDVQRAIEDTTEKRTKDTYGPPMGKRLLMFVDDMNMPRVDTYGTQQPIALLKMFVERKGFYDRGKELSWRNIKDVQLVAAMGPPGGARNAVDPRFISLFSAFEVQPPSNDNLRTIYQAILSKHLARLNNSDITQMVGESLTDITLELYNAVLEKLPPTPSRFHYVFNLRDLSRVYEGLLRSCSDVVQEPWQFLRLWRNEVLRVFHDRLISPEDKTVLQDKVAELVQRRYAVTSDKVMADPVLFGDYRNVLADPDTAPGGAVLRLYEDVGSYSSIQPLFESVLAAYNQKHKPMQLVFFDDALEHLTRIQRTLRLPLGHCLLVGVGGSGKQSLARLAAYTAGCGVFEICLTRGYDEVAFREDLKKLYGMLGAEDKRMVFLFTDSHVADEGFLELINNMLTAGMVPALYDDAEKEGLVSSIRSELTAKGLPDSKEACWAAYVEKCRANLHVVLAMSPVGEALRSRCRNFPGLVNNTVIDWFQPWPEQALSSVATAFLESEDLPASLRPSIVEHMVLVHQSVRRFSTQFAEELRRHNYVTPKNYLDFITNYKTSLAGQRKEITDTSSRLSNGLAKLVQASAEVDVLQKELSQAKVVVEAATQECNQLLEVISVNTADAETKQKSAQEKEAALQVESLQIAQDKEEAEQALSEAIPALEEAAAALNDLKRDDITEIRSFAKPHVLVQRVCECVVILKNLKDVSWAGAKSMMTDPGFLKSLVEFDKDGLTEKQVKRVKTEYMKDPSFTYDNIRNISTAGAGLLKWVLAMVNYYNVAKGVEPKRKKVAEAEKNLRLAQKDLADTKDQLAALNAQLTSLRSQFADKTSEQQDLRAKADLMERRLLAAERLIAGLGSEKERWAADIKALEAAREQLVGDCLLCSSFLSYTGAFTYKYRSSMVYGLWQSDLLSRKVPLSQPFKLESIMTNDVEVAAWASEGLPGDELSVQNGLLTTRAARWPLCIDPQMQAVAWIKRREGKQLEGKVKTFHDPDFLKQLELAIQYGFPFLFEGCDEYIDPVIDPVLERSTTLCATGKRVIQLGDKEVEWDPNFRLYLTSKLSNPHYGPEVSSKTSIINYGLTQQGLAEQLLGVTVAHERADLEEARAGLVADMSTNKALLKKLEDTLLRELSNATGNILDNQELISTLESAKEKAVEISQKLAAAKVTAQEIEEARVRYSPVAVRGAVLFFVMASLSAVNNMYEYSLGAFLKVFNQSLASSKREASLDGRLRSIIDTLTADVYGYTCLGLFEKHKLMFSFQMAAKILEAGPAPLDPQFLDFFLRGNLSLEKHPRRKPHDWLPVQGWQDLMRLTELAAAKQTPGGGQHPLCGVADDITADEAAWQTYYEREAPETAPLPNGYSSKLSQFEVLLLLRCLRVDRVTVAITHFVMATLGERFVTPPVLDYNVIFKQSSETTPVVFVLSPGADPAFDVFRLGEELGFKPGGKLKYMALGQGMGPKAAELIEAGAARGLWVMLQNCHLLPRWLKTLEKILERLQKPHKDFRLWLTSEPTDKFPLGVLQRSLKVVTEPPNGLKLNLRQSYSKISEELLADCRHPAFRPLVYVLGFFHAVVQERRKYGKLGWNVPYDFNETDFRISLALINTYLGKALGSGNSSSEDAIPWATLRYLIGEAMYGGRVSDSFDRRVLTTYLEEYLGDFLFDTFQPFHFYTGRDGSSIDVPPAAPREVYIKAIEALPLVQSPEVFGLHANADISYYTSDTRTLWANLVDLQPRVGAAAGAMSREEFVAGIVRDISAKIPEQFDLPLLAKGLGVPSPMQVVLLQELARWNGVLEAMTSSLQDLQRALSGEIGFSASLEELSTALYNGKLPPAWARLNPATEKPLGPWMTWFSRRQQQYKSWAEEGEPKVMWLAGLHAPETYLAALVQTACRDRGWPLDRSTLYSQVTRFTDPAQVQEKPTHGCYVSGLYLEGAAWDTATGQLTRQAPRQLVDELPLLQIIPVEASRLKLAGTFRAPVYVTQARRNAMGVGLVFEADLASEMHGSHWVLQGVALVLNIDR
ncbi:hypothetical protein OEZ85_010548 [Tetradesmus obliquus]|uniref:AAA+ ATPase domain-containing protein n=1 Tax=Tetradesmus obliquus TaxID=3088 RepID=A0ABY8TPX9_TETOB|nr:hypothetical protein OEZ85_010548 [Tetradesmus obliquus]